MHYNTNVTNVRYVYIWLKFMRLSFRLWSPYETYHARIPFLERYVCTITYSILAYAYPRALTTTYILPTQIAQSGSTQAAMHVKLRHCFTVFFLLSYVIAAVTKQERMTGWPWTQTVQSSFKCLLSLIPSSSCVSLVNEDLRGRTLTMRSRVHGFEDLMCFQFSIVIRHGRMLPIGA